MTVRVYRLGGHPELRGPLNDLAFLSAVIAETQRSDAVSKDLREALGWLRRLGLEAFWAALYRCSPLSERDRLELTVQDGEPVVLIHEAATTEQAANADEAAGEPPEADEQPGRPN